MKRSGLARKYILSDFVAASVTWLLFNLFRYEKVAVHDGFSSLDSFFFYSDVMEGQFFIPFFWLILFYFSGYYNKPIGKSRLTELFSTFVTVTIGVTFVFFVIVLNDLPSSFHVFYQFFFFLYGLQFFLTYLPRLYLTQRCLNRIKEGRLAQNVMIIGVGEKSSRLSADLCELGYHISGYIREEANAIPAFGLNRDAILGALNDLPELITSCRVDELVLAPETSDSDKLLKILYSLYRYKLPIKVLADKTNMLSRVNVKTIYGIPLVDVTDNNFSAAEQNIKFFMDKLCSLLALFMLSPLYLYIAWRVKKDSAGPILFRQERIGYMGEPFIMYKFRTMMVGAEDNGPLLSSEEDRRITPFGRVMRKYRLDELPQFWNVLKGDMSLVGPRPERRYFIDQIVKKAPFYYLLHNVRPGITSWGMVKYGYAGSVDEMIERLEYDILYYENMSLALDITILIYTVKTVITGKGI